MPASITITLNLPVESIEMEYPRKVLEYSLVKDCGGAGQYRGGPGLRQIVEPAGHTFEFFGVGECFNRQSWQFLA